MISTHVKGLRAPLALVLLLIPGIGWGQGLPEDSLDGETFETSPAPAFEEDNSFALHGRFRLGTTTSALQWKQTSDDTTETYPPEASFSHAPFLGPTGLQVETEIWWDDFLAFDMSFSWARYNLKVGNDTISDNVISALVGVRGGYEITSTISGEWGVWFHHSDAVMFKYEANRTNAAKIDPSIDGARVGAAGAMDLDFMVLRMGVYETFSPMPVNTIVEVTGDIPVFEIGPRDNGYPVVLRLRYAADIRHLTDSADSVSLTVTEVYHTLGAALTLEIDYLNEILSPSS